MKIIEAKGKKKIKDLVFLEWVAIMGTIGVDVGGFLALMHQKIMEGTMSTDPYILLAIFGINVGPLAYIAYLKRS